MKIFGAGRELEAEARRVAPGQDRGARRRAGGVARVAGGELHAVARDRVDVRRGHGAVGDAAAGEGEIVVAEVVGDDDDDVRRPRRRRRGAARTRIPRHLARRVDRVHDARQQSEAVQLQVARRPSSRLRRWQPAPTAARTAFSSSPYPLSQREERLAAGAGEQAVDSRTVVRRQRRVAPRAASAGTCPDRGTGVASTAARR